MRQPVNRAQRRAMEKYKGEWNETIIRTRLEKKKKEVMKVFKRQFMDAVEGWVPTRLRVVSLYIPPKLYYRIFETLVDGVGVVEYQKRIYANLTWPEWRKRLYIWPVVFSYRVAKLLFLDWLLLIRRWVATFGITVDIKESKPGYLKQTIRYWGRVVKEGEFKVNV